MVLLDLEFILKEFSEKVKDQIYIPGEIITPNENFFSTVVNTSESIFRILILEETGIPYTHLYTKVNPKDYFKQVYYISDFYIPNSNGGNILQLTSNDLRYIDDVNNGLNSTIYPDSDFLLAHKDINHTPTTTLGKIIKFTSSINEYIRTKENYITEIL